jgi:hypothetical protein
MVKKGIIHTFVLGFDEPTTFKYNKGIIWQKTT